MIKLHEYILAEASQGCKFFYDEVQDIYCQFFPKLDRAYIESEGRSYWYDCVSINEAVSIHMSCNKRDVKRVG